MNFLSLNIQGLAQKAKNDWVNELCATNKACWRNFNFEYVYSPSVGFSGGILCVWDPKMFQKVNSMVSDYFVLIRGEWISNVRTQAERYGSNFNVKAANAFNSFISAAGLEEVPVTRMFITEEQLSQNPYKILKNLLRWRWLKRLKSNGLLKEMRIKYYHGIPKQQKNSTCYETLGPNSFLIGSLYKIIAKIISNRLVVVLRDVVNEVQSAFVANRQILDGPFILNEIFQWCKKKKKQMRIFKVDFEKAYDSVRWDYLDDVLQKFSFGDKLRGWIQSCLRSSRGPVIVNESPTNEFQFHRGLKQGDPLSLFLFILIMESLHILVQRVVDAGMFRGISLGSSLQLSHLFYADDAVFMGQCSSSYIDSIIQVLECFYRVSGLRINMTKSKLMGISVANETIDQEANKIGCTRLKAPFYYLGSKVGDLMSRT
ncbi:RNA-directed DNA polymerase, eukaryota, reverse transcriptase zinc-binding domain protein [Tanacetum coccineum]